MVLVNKHIIPYLYTKFNDVDIKGQTIITNRKQHKKGGVGSYGKFKNEIVNTFAQGNVMVTTLIDFYKLPTDFPSYSPHATDIPLIEEAIRTDIG